MVNQDLIPPKPAMGHSGLPVRCKWLYVKHFSVHDICSLAWIWSQETPGLFLEAGILSLPISYASSCLYVEISKDVSFLNC